MANSTTNYTSSTYIEGDFSASTTYFSNLASSADVSTREFKGTGRDGSYYTYEITANWDYSLLNKNCVQTSIDGLRKGTLADGTTS